MDLQLSLFCIYPNFLATAPIDFVHVFQLWTFPEPWNCPFWYRSSVRMQYLLPHTTPCGVLLCSINPFSKDLHLWGSRLNLEISCGVHCSIVPKSQQWQFRIINLTYTCSKDALDMVGNYLKYPMAHPLHVLVVNQLLSLFLKFNQQLMKTHNYFIRKF